MSHYILLDAQVKWGTDGLCSCTQRQNKPYQGTLYDYWHMSANILEELKVESIDIRAEVSTDL